MDRNSRRDVLASIGALGTLAIASSAIGQPVLTTPGTKKPEAGPFAGCWDAAKGEYTLPPLPYEPGALAPAIDAKTMEIHHTKHHQAYVDGANKAMKQLAAIRDGGDAGLIKHWSRELSFHLGGHLNHSLFWRMMAPAGKGGGGQPTGKLAEAIAKDFGSYEKFLAQFKAAAGAVEGGGWGWLVVDPVSQRLAIVQMEKQQDMMPVTCRPILGVDVWEHAYYLTYQNRRGAYIDAWCGLINWAFVQELHAKATEA